MPKLFIFFLLILAQVSAHFYDAADDEIDFPFLHENPIIGMFIITVIAAFMTVVCIHSD